MWLSFLVLLEAFRGVERLLTKLALPVYNLHFSSQAPSVNMKTTTKPSAAAVDNILRVLESGLRLVLEYCLWSGQFQMLPILRAGHTKFQIHIQLKYKSRYHISTVFLFYV